MSGSFRTRGHDAATALVRRWIVAGSAPHAVLFSGPSNVGKTTLAGDLAAGLLCLAEDPASRPCRSCLACRKVDRGTHPDVHRVVPEGPGGQIRIAAARALATELSLMPVEGRRRLAVIEDAQLLNDDAQNALLKTLEEPPGGVTLLLCVDDEEPILPTVKSRCVRVTLGAVPLRALAGLLAERGVDEPGRAAHIARLAAGRPGVALAIAARPDLELAFARLARRLIDLVGADRRTRLAAASELVADGASIAVLEGSLEGGLETGDPGSPEAGPEGGRPDGRPAAVPPALRRRAVSGLLVAWRAVARDIAVAARGGRDGLRLVALADEIESIAHVTEPGAVAGFLDRLERSSALVEANANPELVLDVLLLAWPRASDGGTRAARGQAPEPVPAAWP